MKAIELLNADKETQRKARKLYEESFPDYERRKWETQLMAAEDPYSRSYIFMADDDTFLGITFYWFNGDMLYGEFLAINPQFRGQNIGSKIVSQLLQDNSDKTFILEIDPPQDEISIRRLHFYEKLGFVANTSYHYIHPSYHTDAEAYPHELLLLSHEKQITKPEYDNFVSFLQDTILKYVD